MTAVLDLLRGFDALDAAARAALEGACAGVISVAPDTDLRREGEALDRLHVLVDGWACRTKLLVDGRRQIPMLLLPGDICDLDGLESPRLPYGVITLTPCRVAVWSHHALATVMRDHPSIGAALLRLALVENAMMTQGIVVLGRHCAREKVAHLLCEIVVRLEAVGRAEPDRYDLPLTQAEMADVLGLSSVHINRVLQDLRGAGLIHLAAERLTVLDYEGLCAVGQFRADHLLLSRAGSHLLTGDIGTGRGRQAADPHSGPGPA